MYKSKTCLLSRTIEHVLLSRVGDGPYLVVDSLMNKNTTKKKSCYVHDELYCNRQYLYTMHLHKDHEHVFESQEKRMCPLHPYMHHNCNMNRIIREEELEWHEHCP